MTTPDPNSAGHSEAKPQVVTVREAARILDIGKTTLYNAMRDGTVDLKPIRIGRRMVISQAALDRLLEKEALPHEAA